MEPKPQPYPTPAAARPTTDPDADHLQLLSIFYYVMAGMSALGGFFALIYVLFGMAMMGGAAAIGERHGGEGAGLAVMGGIFTVMGLTAAVLIWIFAGCLFLTGNYLRQCRHRTFCLIMAGLLCFNVPLGAILGIFTFVVLSRDSVRARFDSNRRNPFAPPPGADFKRYS